MIDVNEQDYLRVLRIGNLTLQELVRHARGRQGETARWPAQRHRSGLHCPRGSPISTVPIISTAIIRTSRHPKQLAGAADFCEWRKEYDAEARLKWYSHLHLLFAYVVHHQKPNVHGGYFEGMLSQELIYRLACLGYDARSAPMAAKLRLGTRASRQQIPDAGVAMLWSNRRANASSNRPDGRRADADREAGGTAARAAGRCADPSGGSRSGRQVHCRGARR